MDDIIVTLRFAETGEARRAMRELKQLDRDGRLRVREAALLERSGQGRVVVPGEGQGVTLVVAEIADPDPDVLDSTLAGLGTTVTRRSARDVYAELEAHESKSA